MLFANFPSVTDSRGAWIKPARFNTKTNRKQFSFQLKLKRTGRTGALEEACSLGAGAVGGGGRWADEVRAGGTQSPDLILGCQPSSLGLGMTWGAGSRTQELQPLQSKCSKCGLGNLGVNSNSVPPTIQSYEMPTALVPPARGSTGRLWDQEWSFLALRSCRSLILRLSENREQKNDVCLGCRGWLATQTPRGQLGQAGKVPSQGMSVFWCWGGAVTCLCGPRVIMCPPVVHLGCLAPENSQHAGDSMAVSVEGGRSVEHTRPEAPRSQPRAEHCGETVGPRARSFLSGGRCPGGRTRAGERGWASGAVTDPAHKPLSPPGGLPHLLLLWVTLAPSEPYTLGDWGPTNRLPGEGGC